MTFTYLKIKELQISKKISGSRFKDLESNRTTLRYGTPAEPEHLRLRNSGTLRPSDFIDPIREL